MEKWGGGGNEQKKKVFVWEEWGVGVCMMFMHVIVCVYDVCVCVGGMGDGCVKRRGLGWLVEVVSGCMWVINGHGGVIDDN